MALQQGTRRSRRHRVRRLIVERHSRTVVLGSRTCTSPCPPESVSGGTHVRSFVVATISAMRHFASSTHWPSTCSMKRCASSRRSPRSRKEKRLSENRERRPPAARSNRAGRETAVELGLTLGGCMTQRSSRKSSRKRAYGSRRVARRWAEWCSSSPIRQAASRFEVTAPATHGGIRSAPAPTTGIPYGRGRRSSKGRPRRACISTRSPCQSTVPDPVDKPPPAERWSGRLIVAGNDDGRLGCCGVSGRPLRWHGPFPVIAVDESADAACTVHAGSPEPGANSVDLRLRRNDFKLIAPDARAEFDTPTRITVETFRFAGLAGGQNVPERLGLVDAVSMIRRFWRSRRLEVVARCGSRLRRCWHARKLPSVTA